MWADLVIAAILAYAIVRACFEPKNWDAERLSSERERSETNFLVAVAAVLIYMVISL